MRQLGKKAAIELAEVVPTKQKPVPWRRERPSCHPVEASPGAGEVGAADDRIGLIVRTIGVLLKITYRE